MRHSYALSLFYEARLRDLVVCLALTLKANIDLSRRKPNISS